MKADSVGKALVEQDLGLGTGGSLHPWQGELSIHVPGGKVVLGVGEGDAQVGQSFSGCGVTFVLQRGW